MRAAREKATCGNVGQSDISGIRKVRETLRSASNSQSVRGCVFYPFIIPVTLNRADISFTCRNECENSFYDLQHMWGCTDTCSYSKEKFITKIILFPLALKGSSTDSYIELLNYIGFIIVSSHNYYSRKCKYSTTTSILCS